MRPIGDLRGSRGVSGERDRLPAPAVGFGVRLGVVADRARVELLAVPAGDAHEEQREVAVALEAAPGGGVVATRAGPFRELAESLTLVP